MDQARLVNHLTDIHTCAAEALVKRSVEDVEALEGLCDWFLRLFGGRQEKTDPIRQIMETLNVSEEDAITAIVTWATNNG